MTRREERSMGSARLVRTGEDDGSFDRRFWAETTASERLEAVWGLVLTAIELTGPHAAQRRLQRSVCRVERRGS